MSSSSPLSILLPKASIDIFVLTNKTSELKNSLEQDWRFGRIKVNIIKGSTDEAIALYETQPSADLVIVETKTIDQAFTDSLQKLGELCQQGTNAFVIGPENDIQLYRRLKDLGVSDYYVQPISSDTIKNDIGRVLTDAKGIAHSQIFAFLGAKGGVGSTTFAHGMASLIANETEEAVCLIEPSLGRSSASILLGHKEPNGTLTEAVRAAVDNDYERLNRMIIDNGANIHVLSTGGEAILSHMPSAADFEVLIDMVAARFPNVVIDCGVADGHIDEVAIRKSNHVSLITDSGLVALRSARTLMQEILALRGSQDQGIYYFVNRAGERSSHEVSDKDISESLNMPLTGKVSYAPKWFGAYEFAEKNILDADAGLALAEELRKILFKDQGNATNKAKSLNKSKTKATGIGGFLNKFTS